MVATTREIQACAEEVCPTVSAWFDTWLAYEVCLGASCEADCTWLAPLRGSAHGAPHSFAPNGARVVASAADPGL